MATTTLPDQHRSTAGRARSRARWSRLLQITAAYLILGTGSIFMLLPFLWMLSTSLKPQQLVLQIPPQWIPNPVAWENYIKIWDLVPLAAGFRNSALVAVLGTVGVLVGSSLAGFAFAKLRFPGREALFIVALGTMMIPGAVLLIPQFVLFRQFGWINTLLPLIVPSLFGAPYETFFFRQFFRTIPDELVDAATIDGCSFFGIYWRVMLPLATPVVAALTILAFMWRWNDFLGPLIYLHRPERQTLPVLIATFQSQYISDYAPMMAVSVLSMLPIIVLFFLAQRYFIEGITMTGLRGGVCLFSEKMMALPHRLNGPSWWPRSRMKRNEALWGYLFVLPLFLGFLLFLGGPLLASLVLSFMKWDILSAPQWVGAANYVELAGDEIVGRAFYNTVFLMLGIPAGIMLSLLLAMAMNQPIRGIAAFRVIYFLPVISSIAAVALLWRWIYNPQFGLLNYMLGLVGIPGPDWLGSTAWAKPALILMGIWGAR
ncbi:ABC transporter permease subunit, partial [Candidatus Gracilibacteria bacterium]|nr:ABC transporter permease subunit [Candidatus Gracilibacteria bacterium]